MMWGTNKSSANHLVCRQVIGFSYHSYDHKISGCTWHVRVKNNSSNCHFQRTVQKFLIIKWQSLIQRNKATGSFATANLPQMNHHDSHKKLSPQKTNPYPNSFCGTNGVFLTTTTCTPQPEILILELFFGGTFLNTLNKNLPNVWKFGSSKRHNPGTNCANANGKWPQYWSHFPYGIWRDLLATNYPPTHPKKREGS